MTIDKIKATVPAQVIETINSLVAQGRKDILAKWLKQCEDEITLRGSGNTYALHCEKYYLEMVTAHHAA